MIPANKVHRFSWDDRVCIIFTGMQVALEGTLCRRPDRIGHDAKSLLACKRLSESKSAWTDARMKEKPPEARTIHRRETRYRGMRVHRLASMKRDDPALLQDEPTVDALHQCAKENISRIDEFFERMSREAYYGGNIAPDLFVCIVYKKKAFALFANGSEIQTKVLLRCEDAVLKGVLLGWEAVWGGFLRGFALKHPEHGCENVRLLTAPQVRKVVCEKQRFINEALQENILKIVMEVADLDGCYEVDRWKVCMQGLGEAFVDPKRQKILWSVEEHDALLHDIFVRKDFSYVDSGTVLCLMRGEPAFLKGVPVPETYKDNAVETNLQVYWNKQVLTPLLLNQKARKTQEELFCVDIG